MIIDKLYANTARNGPVCLGLDTSPAYLPESFAKGFDTEAEAVFAFNRALIDATHDVVACYKVQIAYYEAMGIEGLKAYSETLSYIKSVHQISIADIKRGDIAATAEMYAKAHFSGDFEADMITLNPYMGLDSLEPYRPWLEKGKGCFVLVRTSNKGSRDIQFQDVEGGKLYGRVADMVQSFGANFMGNCGYSNAGAVVGATNAEEGAALRRRLDKTFLLIPGYGAQGGAAGDAALYLTNGNGGVVNNSRAILTAHRKHDDGAARFAACARMEAVAMRDAILSCLN